MSLATCSWESCRRGSALAGRASASIASVTLAEQRADQVRIRYRKADGEFADTTLDRVTPEEVLAGLPVREFRWFKGRQHYSGWYWSSTVSRLVAYESRLEVGSCLPTSTLRWPGWPRSRSR